MHACWRSASFPSLTLSRSQTRELCLPFSAWVFWCQLKQSRQSLIGGAHRPTHPDKPSLRLLFLGCIKMTVKLTSTHSTPTLHGWGEPQGSSSVCHTVRKSPDLNPGPLTTSWHFTIVLWSIIGWHTEAIGNSSWHTVTTDLPGSGFCLPCSWW